jgi:hypothetical protein
MQLIVYYEVSEGQKEEVKRKFENFTKSPIVLQNNNRFILKKEKFLFVCMLVYIIKEGLMASIRQLPYQIIKHYIHMINFNIHTFE